MDVFTNKRQMNGYYRKKEVKYYISELRESYKITWRQMLSLGKWQKPFYYSFEPK